MELEAGQQLKIKGRDEKFTFLRYSEAKSGKQVIEARNNRTGGTHYFYPEDVVVGREKRKYTKKSDSVIDIKLEKGPGKKISGFSGNVILK